MGHVIGHGRYRDTYPERPSAPADVIGAPVRYTPAFQSTNGDASLGTDGRSSGTYQVIGRQLTLNWAWFFGTAGVTVGTGDLLVPLPPGFTVDDIDVDRMVLFNPDFAPGVAQVGAQILSSSVIANTQLQLTCVVLINITDGVPGPVVYLLQVAPPIVPMSNVGDQITGLTTLPLKTG
jgi:hypothetical protein